MDLRLITPDDPAYAEELELRFRALREPLGHTRADVPFPFERESLHLVAEGDGHVIGCVLFHPESARGGRLFQMAVAASLRGRGLGSTLLHRLEGELLRRGLVEVHLHARADVVDFYAAHGYASYGAPYLEVGILHQNMRKTLTAP